MPGARPTHGLRTQRAAFHVTQSPARKRPQRVGCWQPGGSSSGYHDALAPGSWPVTFHCPHSASLQVVQRQVCTAEFAVYQLKE